jgi:hypothetical protein
MNPKKYKKKIGMYMFMPLFCTNFYEKNSDITICYKKRKLTAKYIACLEYCNLSIFIQKTYINYYM